MKKILAFITLTLSCLLYNCSDNSNPTIISEHHQYVIINAGHHYSYYDPITNEPVYENNTLINGRIEGNPIPDLEHVKIGDNTYLPEQIMDVLPGYLSFGYYPKRIRIFENYDSLNIEIQTSQGKLVGKINLPYTIENITFSEEDTLELNSPFTISWDLNKADFFYVKIRYQWFDSLQTNHFEEYQEYVYENYITFPDTFFTHKGKINYLIVRPINGPLPQINSEGNMTGDGVGFLYYQNYGAHRTLNIVVGR